jgi:hypothetical protein
MGLSLFPPDTIFLQILWWRRPGNKTAGTTVLHSEHVHRWRVACGLAAGARHF